MNYDQTTIPEGYNRGREHGPVFREQWMVAVQAATPKGAGRILDLGCGTGRFSRALSERLGAEVVGVDPSWKMLRQAAQERAGRGIRYVLGSGEAIPLLDGTVDLVFVSMVFHHFTDRAAAASECRRVLRPGGRVFLRTGARERVPDYPYVPYFPASWPVLEARLPSLAEQCGAFEAAGFSVIGTSILVQQVAANLTEYADKIAAGGDSVLASLSGEDFAQGLSALRAAAASVAPTPVVEPIDIAVFEVGEVRC
jgi:ubiquinone/menaquinone biosynthesis C-methylase UbiE